MHTDSPVTVYLKDYHETAHEISHVDLSVALHPTVTVVDSTLSVKHRAGGVEELRLHGEGLVLNAIAIDGRALSSEDYKYAADVLTVFAPPSRPFKLSISQSCNPQANTALSGLYVSGGVFCTQMEAEGFRRFAFMQDRPDVMATYRVRVEAPLSLPVLLSNGNLVETGRIGDSHFAIWQDPHPKPTYLFALVAGDLAAMHDRFVTADGLEVSLGIYVERGKEDRCAWAMACLKASMRWDEERFGRCYDLEVFNIVAVSDFNMGAMENKGLNIFNDKYILARPDTATDTDYINIERIIAHEYFHNWTGNRITCRDWFQLCLKEGLTVFRDQEFTADLRSRAVKRIEDVKTLRARQFPEDHGPLAHAVRPSSYIEINNFYTPTIYEKGAEICRMLFTLLGPEKFRQAMDLYFQRHDGEAATVEDFLCCMAEASGRDLSQFALWYEKAGTPIVEVNTAYDARKKEYRVALKQTTLGKLDKQPLHMPIGLGLLDCNGIDIDLREVVELRDGVYEFRTEFATLVFHDVGQRPVLSINRGFSAPIVLRAHATDDDLLFQMSHDSDSFNRWEAAQTCAKQLFVAAYNGQPIDIEKFASSLSHTLNNSQLDDAFKALMLQLPGEAEVTVAVGGHVNAQVVHETRRSVLAAISYIIVADLKTVLLATQSQAPYRPDVTGTSRRSLRGAALTMMSYTDPVSALHLAHSEFSAADNMTQELVCLQSVLSVKDPAVDGLLEEFYDRHRDDHLLVDKWFLLKAARAATASDIEALMMHSAFTLKTPNRVYALLGGFTGANLKAFHSEDGAGYYLLADSIMSLNSINPQVAARMASGFRSWGLYDETRKVHARKAMQRILSHFGLSNDVFEIISRTISD